MHLDLVLSVAAGDVIAAFTVLAILALITALKA
jgi:hypothetical protein